MSLKDALKRAAGLVIEFSPDDQAEEHAAESITVLPGVGRTTTDKMWDDLEQSTKTTNDMTAQTGNASIQTQAPESASPSSSARTVEQIVRDAAGPNLDQISVTGADLPEIFGPDGEPHFAPIYTRAGLPPVSYSAEQMLEMLTSLPAELPLVTRKQTVNAMLKGMGAALGASPESLVADASRKLAALAAYVDSSSTRGDEHVHTCQLEIQSFEAQIADRRNSIEAEQSRQAKITQACTAQAGELHQVLEFFSTSSQSQP